MAREGGTPVSWRWKGGPGGRVTLEFFCPSGPDREPGRLYRPGGVVGGKLSALVLAAGILVDRDRVEKEVEVLLPGGGGRTLHRLHVAGPAAYLATKVDALRRRNKNKDAYDIVWLLEAWPGGQLALAEVVRGSPIFSESEMQSALDALRGEFASIDAAGAIKFAKFTSTDETDFAALARRAVGAVAEFLRALSG